MDHINKGKVGTREFFAVIIFSIGMKVTDSTPALFFQAGENGAWLIVIFSFLALFPSYLLLLSIMKGYPNKNLIEVIQQVFGRLFGLLVGLIIFFIGFAGTVLDTRNFVDTLSIMYYPQTPELALYYLVMLTVFLIAKRGWEVLGSMSWLLLPYILVSFVFLYFLGANEGTWLRVFPLFGEGLKEVAIEGVYTAGFFGDVIILVMAYGSLKSNEAFRKASIWGVVVTFLLTTSFVLLFSMIFDYESIDKVAFPFHELTRMVQVGNYFTNIETFFLPFWLLGTVVRFGIYLYFITWIFGAVFKIKEFESLLLPITFLVLTVGCFPENPYISTLVYRDLLFHYDSIALISLPILLWVVDKARGGHKSE